MSPLKKTSTASFEIGLPPPQNSPASHTEAQKANREEPLRPHLCARGDAIQTHSGWGARSKSTVAHARQRRVTVCSLTWQEPVKYTLGTNSFLFLFFLQASSLTASVRVQSYKGGEGNTKDIQRLFYGCIQNKQSKQLLQQEKSGGLASGIISTAAGKPGLLER